MFIAADEETPSIARHYSFLIDSDTEADPQSRSQNARFQIEIDATEIPPRTTIGFIHIGICASAVYRDGFSCS